MLHFIPTIDEYPPLLMYKPHPFIPCMLFSYCMYQFLLHFYRFLALKWGEDGIMNYWKILQHHHILQGVFFSHLRVTKRYLPQDTTSQQPQNPCFHFLL